jgi:capsular exopolysaccharide synthesis family protein
MTVVIAIAVCLVLGVVATLLMQPIYTARTTLQIDRESARVVNVTDVTPDEQMIAGEEFFQTQYGVLRSRSLQIRVAEALGLTRDNKFITVMGKPAIQGTDAASTARRRERVLGLLRDNLQVTPTRGSRLVTLTFDSPDPALSSRVANAFADGYITSNLERKFESSSYARDFLQRRLAETKAKLEQSERDLVAYATDQQIIQLTDRGAGPNAAPDRSLESANLEALNEALAKATGDRILVEARWRQAHASSGLGLPEVLQSPTVQQLSQDRARLMAEYQQKLKLYRPTFAEMVQLNSQIEETSRQLQAQTDYIRRSIDASYAAALDSEQTLRARVEGLKRQVLDLRGRSIRYNILQREADTNRTLYEGLLQRFKEVGVAGGVTTQNISILDRAEPPLRPSKPNLLLNMAISLAFGLGLSVLLAFVLEALDSAIRLPADVEQKLGLVVLGNVPLLEKGVTPSVALADTRTTISEAYQTILSTLQFSTLDGLPRSLLVTSARPSEGKSTTAFALARNLARLGFRTVLVDADLRNPSLHKVIGADNATGLTNVLTRSMSLAEVVQDTKTPLLWLVPSGPIPPNPAELLATDRLTRLNGELAAQFDYLVIDGPPVVALADAPKIASVVQGTVLVVEAGGTGRGEVAGAIRRLRLASARLLGVVLTKFDTKQAGYGYGYSYQYDYDYGRKDVSPRIARIPGRWLRSLKGGK